MSDITVRTAPGAEDLRRLVIGGPDGIVVVDRHRIVLFANPSAERMLRQDGARLVGSDFGHRITDDAVIRIDATGVVAELHVSELIWEGRPARLVVLRDIGDRRQAVLDAERWVAQLCETERLAGSGSWEYDLATERLTCSPGLARILGRGSEMVPQGRDEAARLIHPDDRDRVRRSASDVALGKHAAFDLEYRIVRPDGEARVLRTAGEAVTGPDGRVVMVRGTVRDVTEVRHAEQERRQAHRLLELVADNTAAVVMVVDPECRMMFGNTRFAQMLGCSPAELLGMTYHDLLPAELADAVRAHSLRVLAEGTASTQEIRLDRGDGTMATWLSLRFPIRGEDGRPFAVGTVSVDVTEQRRATEALRRSEERFRLLTDNSLDVIILIRLVPEPKVEYVSPAAETVLGVRPGDAENTEVVGTLLGDAGLERLEEDLLSPGERRRVSEFVRPDGSVAWIERRGLGLYDDSGRLTAVELTLRDVTDVVTAEEERHRLEGQLEQAEHLDAVGRLAGGVAHDFNNLLAVILGNAEFLAEDFDEADTRREEVERIAEAAQRGAALTKQLLIFSRRESSRPEVLDVNQIITTIESILRRTIGEDIDLVIRRGPELPAVEIDRSKLEQVLINLAVNARVAIANVGRLTIETAPIHVTAPGQAMHGLAGDAHVPAGDYVRITVADTGRAMAADAAAHAFESSSAPQESGEGSGLGLATAYDLIKEAGGYVTLDSRGGEGTTFQILLPVVPADTGAAAVTNRAAPQGTGETVLVVEDEDAVREVVVRVLGRNGYHVLAARCADDALEIYSEPGTTIDLLLTDVIMPGMTGVQLAERLLGTDHGGLQVLFMSGYTAGQRPLDPALHPGSQVLRKPFDADTLLHRVRESLHGE